MAHLHAGLCFSPQSRSSHACCEPSARPCHAVLTQLNTAAVSAACCQCRLGRPQLLYLKSVRSSAASAAISSRVRTCEEVCGKGARHGLSMIEGGAGRAACMPGHLAIIPGHEGEVHMQPPGQTVDAAAEEEDWPCRRHSKLLLLLLLMVHTLRSLSRSSFSPLQTGRWAQWERSVWI
mgnify:CR=1 FL=1